MLTRGSLVKCNEHNAVVLKQFALNAVQICYLCAPAHNYTFEMASQLVHHYDSDEPIQKWMNEYYAGQKVQLVEDKTGQVYTVAALNYVELSLCLQRENGECCPDWVPVETVVPVYTIQMNGNDIRYGPFKKGDRVQVQVDGDKLMGMFDRYHEEDSNLVWISMEDSHDPKMQNAWEIGRVSLAGREISPEEAVRRGDERLKLDDIIDHPAHYTTGKIEVIDFIEDKGLGFHLGNVVKYVARAEHKGKALEDLKKARWYLNREIERRENETS